MEHALIARSHPVAATRMAPVVAGAGGALALSLAGMHYLADPLAAAQLVILGAALGALALYDVRERRIPNRVVLSATAVCAGLSLAGGVRPNIEVLSGAGIVALALAVGLAAPAGIGMGDVKLALLVLCALDDLAPVALIAAIELYAGIGLVLLVSRGRAALGMSLPLAPIVAAGSLLAVLL